MTVMQDGIQDGIIPILITWITHLQPEMRLIVTLHLKSSGTLKNSRFNLNQHPECTIIILIMVPQLPITRVMVVHWNYLLSEYPEPLQTIGYGIPSNTIIQYYSRGFASL